MSRNRPSPNPNLKLGSDWAQLPSGPFPYLLKEASFGAGRNTSHRSGSSAVAPPRAGNINFAPQARIQKDVNVGSRVRRR